MFTEIVLDVEVPRLAGGHCKFIHVVESNVAFGLRFGMNREGGEGEEGKRRGYEIGFHGDRERLSSGGGAIYLRALEVIFPGRVKRRR